MFRSAKAIRPWYNKQSAGGNGYTVRSRRCLSIENPEQDRNSLEEEAAVLTRSLYRICIRSVRLIRHGNAQDEENFAQIEREREKDMEPSSSKSRITMLSMMPPVDREDELRSRYEYYLSYTRENFVQESDIFSINTKWGRRELNRYLYHLRRGEEQRRWLLDDMKFDDPYQLNENNVQALEKRVNRLFDDQQTDRSPKKLINPFDPEIDDDGEGLVWSDDEEDE